MFPPRSMPTSWLTESSTQPSCSSSKTPSGSSLLITKASSTCLVGPSHAIFNLPLVSCTFCDGCCRFVAQTEKYFDMKKTQCKEGLDIYKKFLTRMTRISEFLKVAEVCCVVFSPLSLRPCSTTGGSNGFISRLNSRWASIEETSRTFRRWAQLKSKLFFTASSSYLFLISLYLFVRQKIVPWMFFEITQAACCACLPQQVVSCFFLFFCSPSFPQ